MIFVSFVQFLLATAFDWCMVLLELRGVVFYFRFCRVLVVMVVFRPQCPRFVHRRLRSLFAAVLSGYVGAQGWHGLKVSV